MRQLLLAVFGTLPFSVAQPQDELPPTLKVPAEVKAPPATICEVKAETTCKVVVWVVLTPGLSARPIDGGRVLLFAGPTGRYECLAYTARGDVPSDPARCVIVIGTPGPEPKPPDPPADPLRAKLKVAFDADNAPLAQKREQTRDLAALYRAAAKLAEDSAVGTSGELLRRVRDAAGTLVGADALKDVRRVVGGELATLLPIDVALTGSQRTTIAALFRQLSDILDGF